MRTLLGVAGSLAVITAFALSTVCRSATAATFEFTATLNGSVESPPNNAPGLGSAIVDIDTIAETMRLRVTFAGLTTGTTASHIHCCTAVPGTGTAQVATTVPTFLNFPLGVTSGTYHQTFDMTLSSSYNPAFVSASGSIDLAFAALLAGMIAGEAYLNVHTSAFPGGEIRGFLTETPLPAALPLFATGLGALGLLGWRRKQKTPMRSILPA